MSIGNDIVGLIDVSCIVGYFFFFKGVDNGFSSLVFWKVFKDSCPASFSCEGLTSYLLTICQQVHYDRLWTKTVLVAIVLPYLAEWNGSPFRSMGIGEVGSFYTGFITRNSFFIYRVNNFLSILIFWKIFKLISPLVFCCDLFTSDFYCF